MNRTTEQMLEARIGRLNELTESPQVPWREVNGRYIANIGNYHLSGAYGGVALHRMMNEDGGVVDVFGRGCMPKRELWELLGAYMAGIAQANQDNLGVTIYE